MTKARSLALRRMRTCHLSCPFSGTLSRMGEAGNSFSFPFSPIPLMNFGINNRGEIVGGLNSDTVPWTPTLWKPLNHQRDVYGSPIILKGPDGYADAGWADGINDLGDISGVMWGSAGQQAMLWSSNDLRASQLLGFPGDWSVAWKLNNFRIAVGGFGGGSCPGG